MIANALFIAVALLLALVFRLMGELKFFVPYKLVLWREYELRQVYEIRGRTYRLRTSEIAT